MNTERYAYLVVATERAQAAFDKNPTDTNFKRLYELATELRGLLRERQDAKAGAS